MRPILKTYLSNCEEFIQIMWNEFGGRRNSDILVVLFYDEVSERCREAGDKVRAEYFAKMAMEIREVIEGTDSPGAKFTSSQLAEGGAWEACLWGRST